jgi:hypothetical protein
MYGAQRVEAPPTAEPQRCDLGSIGNIEHAAGQVNFNPLLTGYFRSSNPFQLTLVESKTLFPSGKSILPPTQRPGARFLQRFFPAQSKPLEQSDNNLRGNLGLTTLYNPSDPWVEYVFIHGLGGGSTKTWCFRPDLSYFWPKEWPPHHPGFRNVRIHTFGYNSDWRRKGATCVDIPDFGQSLLAAMRNSECFSKV